MFLYTAMFVKHRNTKQAKEKDVFTTSQTPSKLHLLTMHSSLKPSGVIQMKIMHCGFWQIWKFQN